MFMYSECILEGYCKDRETWRRRRVCLRSSGLKIGLFFRAFCQTKAEKIIPLEVKHTPLRLARLLACV